MFENLHGIPQFVAVAVADHEDHAILQGTEGVSTIEIGEDGDRRELWNFRRMTIGEPKDKMGNPTQNWECAIAGKFNVNRCRSSRGV
jgi:hypothetical protein